MRSRTNSSRIVTSRTVAKSVRKPAVVDAEDAPDHLQLLEPEEKLLDHVAPRDDDEDAEPSPDRRKIADGQLRGHRDRLGLCQCHRCTPFGVRLAGFARKSNRCGKSNPGTSPFHERNCMTKEISS